MESPDSSSPIVTRAVAGGLRNDYVENFELPQWQKIALGMLGRLPQSVARAAIPPFQRLSAIPPSAVSGLTIDDLCSKRLADYAPLSHSGRGAGGEGDSPPLSRKDGGGVGGRGRYPAITIGVALGGTTAHLSLALNAPFLPQAFVITMQGGSYDGNVQAYFQRSHALALDFAVRSPNVLTIQHYDPV